MASFGTQSPTRSTGAHAHGQGDATGIVAALQQHEAVLLIALIAAAYSLFTLRFLQQHVAISNVDFWYYIDQGRALSWSQTATLSDGLYPLGYPFLLRSAIDFGIDVLRFSQFLSWLGGLLGLVTVLAVTYHTTRSPALIVVNAVVFFTNFYILYYTDIEGSDTIAAGLQMMSILLLWLAAPDERPARARWQPLAAGAVLGLAYLTRYTALILVPLGLVYLLWKNLPLRRAAAPAALFLGAFAVVTAVQTIPSFIVYGQPLYNEQAKNIWYGIYGGNDFVANWNKVPNTISLPQVIAMDPLRFATHWLYEFSGAFYDTSLNLWPAALQCAWLLGLVLIIFDRRLHPANRFLLVLMILGPIAATSLAWLQARFLLVTLMAQTVAVTLAAERVARSLPFPKIAALVVLGIVLAAGESELSYSTTKPTALGWALQAPVLHAQQVNEFLRAAGMQDPSRVATNDSFLHATDTIARIRYAQTVWDAPSPSRLQELLTLVDSRQWTYLVLNYENGYGNYAPIREEAAADKAHLVPLSLDPAATIYCVQPCAVGGERPAGLVFDRDLELTAFRAQNVAGKWGLFLYWEALQPLSGAYEVEVQLVDARGAATLAAKRSAPQIGTYPTPQWPAGARVTDFHYLEPQSDCSVGCRVEVRVYSSDGAAPVMAYRQDGQPAGSVVALPLP